MTMINDAMTDHTAAVPVTITRERQKEIEAAYCISRVFQHELEALPRSEILDRVTDALLTTETWPIRWGSWEGAQDFLLRVISERAATILRHEAKIWGSDDGDGRKRITDHLLRIAGLPTYKSIFYVDNLAQLSVMEVELRRIQKEMRIGKWHRPESDDNDYDEYVDEED